MSGRRPLIGVTTSDYKSRVAWFFDWLAVWRAGGWPVRLSPGRSFDPALLDGLVVGGGDDIEAHVYGGEISLDVRVDPARDRLELELLDAVVPSGKPVLGICRGAQMINVFHGGTLHADIDAVYEDARRMRTVLPRMTIEIDPDTRLRQILGIARCRVNSLHHQSVDRLGHGLRAVAHERSGIVQGIECAAGRFLIGVQWHPEFLVLNRHQQHLFRALVVAAGPSSSYQRPGPSVLCPP